MLLLVIVSFVVFKNFSAHTWLTGWDTLHPEFDFKLNLERMIFSAWREDQGLGAVAAHAHMSDFPRIILMILLWFFIPLYSIKFAYVALCLVFGPIGIYFFIREILIKDNKKKESLLSVNVASFLGGLFYLLNLGTVQHFYVVFEMFAVQYAFLGWLFLFALKYLKKGESIILVGFFLISFFSASMAYASLLWFAYFAGFSLFLFSYFINNRKIEILKKSLILLFITFLANSFWFLPNMYFLFSGASKIPQQSHINSLFSEEAFLHNQAYGSIKDVALLKNFLFNWNHFDFETQEFVPLLQVWHEHLNNVGVVIIGYTFSIIALLGIVIAFFKRKKILVSLIPAFLLSLLMIINANGLMENLFLWLRDNISLFSEALRFPFTKFSIIVMMIFSIFIAYAFYELFNLFGKLKNRILYYSFVIFTSLFVFGSLAWYVYPIFNGNLIGEVVQNEIPKEYFHLFSWAKNQPHNYRIAVMPLYSYAGWEHHDWGYEGPGFIWFGLKQPVLMRDFDRWNAGNETFYNQLSTAIYKDDLDTFKRFLIQYDVGYVVIDESIILPKQDRELLKINLIHDYLNKINSSLVWQRGFLSAYDVSEVSQISKNSFVYSPEEAVLVKDDNSYGYNDPIYNLQGNYFSSDNNYVKNEGLIFPFLNFSNVKLPELEYKDSADGFTRISYSYKLENDFLKINLPEFIEGKSYPLPVVSKYIDNYIELSVFFPYQIYVDGDSPLIDNHFFKVKMDLDDNRDDGLIETEMINFIYGSELELKINNKKIKTTDVSKEITNFLLKTIEDTNRKKIYHSDLRLEVLSKRKDVDLLDLDNDFNCSVLGEGGTYKEFNKNGVLYKADSLGAVCDSVFLDFFKTSFVLKMSGNGIEGRGAKISVVNLKNTRPSIEEILPTYNFNDSFGIESSSTEVDGYSLYLETRSFGERSSVNTIESISYYLFPLDTVSKIFFNHNSIKKYSGVEIKDMSRFGNSFYYGKLRSNDEEKLVYLSQSFDDGWIAFSKTSKQNLKHFKYNSWANAWILPEGEHFIIIFYWPQLLTFLGYILLLAGLIWSLRVFVKYKRKSI